MDRLNEGKRRRDRQRECYPSLCLAHACSGCGSERQVVELVKVSLGLEAWRDGDVGE